MDFWPGFALKARDTENSIGWRRDKFAAVEKRIVRIPYFNGSPRAMPLRQAAQHRHRHRGVVRELPQPGRHRALPPPAALPGPRHAASRSRLANRLAATGIPVFITGDMNERAAYFCALTAGAPMVAARGGTHDGGCQADRPRAVDWIFGSQGVTFSGYFEDRSRLVDITTDHPVVVSRVRIVGQSPEAKTD